MIRSDDEGEYETMRDRFGELCRAAALATDTTVEVTFSGRARTMRNNRVLADRFRANMAAFGVEDQGDDPNAGSTDMANVSWVCPTIHPDLAIAPEGTPGHSILFRDAAVTPRADDVTILAATLVAQTALELFSDPALVAAAWQEFHRPD
jgi:metal-dependent amidase/aminoacylase/carboxypeptidase family protein